MTRRLSVWLAGAAVLAAVLVLVGCAVSTSVVPVAAAKHPAYTAGTACDASGCHDTYKHKAPYTGECQNCHTLGTWKPAAYAHQDTTFDNGMHPLVGCAMCHTEGEALPSGGCLTCHDAPHGGSKTCTSCHTTTAWGMRKPLPAKHVSRLGGHSKLVCFDCHTTKTPVSPRTCVDCHGTNHSGQRACQDCHDPSTGWQPKPGWSHDRFFKIVGQHAKLECTQCHTGGRFAGTPKVCVGCHGKQHGGLTDCASCHTPSASAGFKYTTFKHASTGFPLTGKHTKVGCMGSDGVQCHYNGRFAQVRGNGSHRCVDCHGTQHGGLIDCASCHTTAGFSSATFRHQTVFPLVGNHTVPPRVCSDCHVSGEFVGLNTACASCHAGPHGVQYTDCAVCHTPADTTLKFKAINRPYPAHPVPLGTGLNEHGTMACTLCHRTPDLSVQKACVDCHSATIPHVGPTGCARCHVPTQWSDMRDFTHPQINGFGVTGPHHYLDFGPYPAGCIGCHPGTATTPDFTSYSCTAAGCHQ